MKMGHMPEGVRQHLCHAGLATVAAICLAGCNRGPMHERDGTKPTSSPQLGLAAEILGHFGPDRRANLEAGQRIAMGVAACDTGSPCYPCFQCHGLRGEGSGIAQFPRLAGQEGRYLRTSLERFASGLRVSDTMHEVALGLTPRDVDQVVAYYAALDTGPLPVPLSDEQRQAAETLGKQIEEQGVPERGVPACVTCHGVAVRKSGAGYPDLAGQYAGYLVAQLDRFRQGQRNGPDAVIMQTIARGLTPEQSSAVSTYYSLMRHEQQGESKTE